jgi:stage II sporulation protein D
LPGEYAVRKAVRQADMAKWKAGLLAVGLLILIFILCGRREDKNTQESPLEEFTEIQDMELEETQSEKEEERVIRVLIKTENYEGIFHKELRAVSEEKILVKGKEDGRVYESGFDFSFSSGDGILCLNGEARPDFPACLILEQSGEGGAEGICLSSLERAYGIPVYEGRLEICMTKEGFTVVNELPLETYLKYVVPSEMPSSWQMEALKAQAVCARTYACAEMEEYAYPEYAAHVDDSVSYQVYNNQADTERTDTAVEETRGQVLTCEGQPITACYFSTSCGYTGDGNVSEEEFADFLSERDEGCYDADSPWYRWEVQVDVKTLSEHLNAALASQKQNVGTIRSMEVLERNKVGAVSLLRVTGSKDTVEIATEYNVRAYLNAQGCNITRADESQVEGGTLLPSACMVITPVTDNKGSLKAFSFRGGGFGHGIGMSQNGAQKMAGLGKNYEEILSFYYSNAELTEIGTL